MHPNPLNVAAEKLFFFLLWPLLLMLPGTVSLLVVLEKVERREEMVDLQRVDGVIGEIRDGFGSVSGMVWLNWFLGLLHLMCSDTAEASVTAGMIWRERGRAGGRVKT